MLSWPVAAWTDGAWGNDAWPVTFDFCLAFERAKSICLSLLDPWMHPMRLTTWRDLATAWRERSIQLNSVFKPTWGRSTHVLGISTGACVHCCNSAKGDKNTQDLFLNFFMPNDPKGDIQSLWPRGVIQINRKIKSSPKAYRSSESPHWRRSPFGQPHRKVNHFYVLSHV